MWNINRPESHSNNIMNLNEAIKGSSFTLRQIEWEMQNSNALIQYLIFIAISKANKLDFIYKLSVQFVYTNSSLYQFT